MSIEHFAEVVDADAIKARVEQIGEEITADYAGEELLLLGILHGSVIFTADLLRQLGNDTEVDFMSLTRFGHDGRVNIAMDSATPVKGRHVLIVEDIVDTGLTLTSLRRMLEAREPASLAAVSLLDKTSRRIVDVPIEYRGFEVGDEYLLGYGLDWQGLYRNLPSLWAVLDMGHLTEHPLALAEAVFDRRSLAGGAGGF